MHHCKDDFQVITDSNNGEILCGNCGTILDERIPDTSHDSRSLSMENYFANSRTGSPTKLSMYDMGTSSLISKKHMDASGNKLSSKSKSHFLKMRWWDARSKRGSKEKNLITAFTLLDSLKDKLALPENAVEHSAYLYRKAVEKKIIRGQSIPSMTLASVYTTCKMLGIPRSLDEVAKVGNVNRKTLSRCYRRLVRKLKLSVTNNVDYISKVANSIKIDEKSRRISSKILNDAKKNNIHVGKNPVGLAVASVYLSSIGTGKNVTMASLARKHSISTVTIRKMAKLLKPFAAKYLETIQVSI